MIRRIADSPTPVPITGETGTGKELIARAIHEQSRRSKYPFVAINCSSIPDNLFESELFGYEEGSFTGAKKGGKIGKIEMAQGGTLFLDEIGEMPLFAQPKLLRILQEYELERVGPNKKIHLDIRVIAATSNRDSG
ncbi:MAG: sigma-54 factor interaction domain-containing protein [Clostridium sp.]